MIGLEMVYIFLLTLAMHNGGLVMRDIVIVKRPFLLLKSHMFLQICLIWIFKMI